MYLNLKKLSVEDIHLRNAFMSALRQPFNVPPKILDSVINSIEQKNVIKGYPMKF